MNIENPYAPPKAASVIDDNQDCRREGKYVFVPKGRDLPPRCIICNGAAVVPVKQKTMYWHSPWLYLPQAMGSGLRFDRRYARVGSLCPFDCLMG